MHRSEIPELRGLRLEDVQFQVSLKYMTRDHPKKQRDKTTDYACAHIHEYLCIYEF